MVTPVPLSQLANLRPDIHDALTEFDLFLNQKRMIGLQLFPVIETQMQAGTYPQIKVEALLRQVDTSRGMGGAYNFTEFDFTTGTFATVENGLVVPTDQRSMNIYNQFGLELVAAKLARHTVYLNQEIRIQNQTQYAGVATPLTAAFTVPAAAGTVTIAVGSTASLTVGMWLYIQGAGYYSVSAIVDSTHVTVTNQATGTTPSGWIVAGNIAAASTVATGGVVTPLQQSSINAFAPWNKANSATATPIDDVEAQVQALYDQGVEANALVIGWKTFRNLRNCQQIIDRINAHGAGAPAKPADVTLNMLSACFDLEHIMVGGAQYNPNNESAATGPLIQPVWNNTIASVCRVCEDAQDFNTPCIGRTFHWDGDGSSIEGTFESWYDINIRGDKVRMRMESQEKLLYPNAVRQITMVG
jgi:hypothetical protein